MGDGRRHWNLSAFTKAIRDTLGTMPAEREQVVGRIRACTHKTRRATRPLFPQKLTFYSAICMSALCQQRKSVALFDHLVGKRKHRWGNLNTQYLGGLQIKAEVKLGWSLDRNIADALSL